MRDEVVGDVGDPTVDCQFDDWSSFVPIQRPECVEAPSVSEGPRRARIPVADEHLTLICGHKAASVDCQDSLFRLAGGSSAEPDKPLAVDRKEHFSVDDSQPRCRRDAAGKTLREPGLVERSLIPNDGAAI